MSAMSTRLMVLVLMAMALGVVLSACGTAPEDRSSAADALPPRPWNIAHRGAAAYAPENTIPAYTLGADQGAHFVEIDLQRTKDGQLISLHDNTLERTTDVAPSTNSVNSMPARGSIRGTPARVSRRSTKSSAPSAVAQASSSS
jgi:glycerophosphoryl diester phosphodiesterase